MAHPDVHVTIQGPSFNPNQQISVLDGKFRAAINEIYDHTYTLVSPEPDAVDPRQVLGAPITVRFEWPNGQQVWHGTAAKVDQDYDSYHRLFVTTLRFVPRLWRLSQRCDLFFHVDCAVPDAVRATLTRAGLSEGRDFDFRLSANYPRRNFILQYNEDDLAFIGRLCEHWGICFFFEQDDGRDKVVFSDSRRNWSKGPAPTVDFADSGERYGITHLRKVNDLLPQAYCLRDHDYSRGNQPWEVTLPVPGGTEGTLVEYGANFESLGEGEMIATARVQEMAAQANMCHGEVAEPVLIPGTVFSLADHPMWNGTHFATISVEAEFRTGAYAQTVGKPEDQPHFVGRFEILDAEHPVRPRRRTPRPRVRGILPAVTQPGPDPQYAQVDEQGRYAVCLLWAGTPQSETADAQAPRYPFVRMAQPHGGPGYGFHFPLRPNVEVALVFIDGDIDRPVIMAHVPDPTTPSVVAAGNHTSNILQTGGGNRMHIEDKAGSQRIKLGSPHADSIFQLGAPNAPEEGGFWGTKKSVTSYAGQTCTALSHISNLYADFLHCTVGFNIYDAAGKYATEAMIRTIAGEACTLAPDATGFVGGKTNTMTKFVSEIGSTTLGVISAVKTIKGITQAMVKLNGAWAAKWTELNGFAASYQSILEYDAIVAPVGNFLATAENCAALQGTVQAYVQAPSTVIQGTEAAVLTGTKAYVVGSEHAELVSPLKTCVSSAIEVSSLALVKNVMGVGPDMETPALHKVQCLEDGVTISSPVMVEASAGEADTGSTLRMTEETIRLINGPPDTGPCLFFSDTGEAILSYGVQDVGPTLTLTRTGAFLAVGDPPQIELREEMATFTVPPCSIEITPGAVTITAGDNTITVSDGAVAIASGDAVTIDASEVSINAGDVNIVGNVSVEGTLDVV